MTQYSMPSSKQIKTDIEFSEEILESIAGLTLPGNKIILDLNGTGQYAIWDTKEDTFQNITDGILSFLTAKEVGEFIDIILPELKEGLIKVFIRTSKGREYWVCRLIQGSQKSGEVRYTKSEGSVCININSEICVFRSDLRAHMENPHISYWSKVSRIELPTDQDIKAWKRVEED